MKLKRLFWANVLLVLFTSCVSKPVPIPGDNKKSKDSIYNEYIHIADGYFDLEKYDKAVEYYELCLENKSLYWGAFYKIAKIKALQSKWNEALPMYEQILNKDPDNSTIKSSLAYIYAMEGDTQKALVLYEEIYLSQSENQEYLENYIAILIQSENKEKAKEELELLKTKYPDSKNISVFESNLSEN